MEGVEFAILGAKGMLGQAFVELLTQRQQSFVAYDLDLNLTDEEAIRDGRLLRAKTWINCAAYTNVDLAEQEEDTASRINGVALALLGRYAKECAAVLVNFGTDYVFSGDANTPYTIETPLAPLGAYGRSKALGERNLMGSGCSFLHVRTSWLYAPFGKNFVLTMGGLIKKGAALKVVDDQRGRPTSALHLARTTLQLLSLNTRGIVHVTDGGECSWHGFAQAIADVLAPGFVVTPCTTAEFPRPARRPAYSVLDISRVEALCGKMPDYRENLAETLSRAFPV